MYTRSIQRLVADTKAKITDEELFGSSAYQNYLQTVCDNVSGRYGRNCSVQTVFDLSDETIAYTDNSVVFINTANVLIRHLNSITERHLGMIGLLGHECGHILFTDFPIINHMSEYIGKGKLYPRWPTKKQLVSIELVNNCDELKETITEGNKYKLSILISLIKNLCNIIEDGYVERKMKLKFPGTVALGLQLVNKAQNDKTPTLSEMISNGLDPVVIFQNLILSYCKVGQIKNPDGIKNEFTDRIVKCIPVLDSALCEDDSKERFMTVNLMLLYWWNYIKPLLDKVDEQETKQDSSESNEKSKNCSSSNGDSEKSSNTGNSSNGSPEKSSNTGNSLNGDSEKNSNSVCSSNGDSDNDSDSNENMKESSKGNSNTGDFSLSDSEEKSDNNSGSNGESSNKRKKSEQEQAQTADEIIKQLQKEIIKSSEEAMNMKTKSILNESQSSSESKETPKGEQQRLQHLKTTVESIAANGDGTVTHNNDYTAKTIDHDLNKLLSCVSQEKVYGAVEDDLLNELKEDVRNFNFGDVHKNVNISINRQRFVGGKERLLYEQEMIKLKPISKMLQKNIMNVIKQRQRGSTERGLYIGTRLDHNAYYRGDGQIFTKRNRPNDEISLSVGLLIDMSGSMSGSRIEKARATALVVYDFCRLLNIPVTIYGHDTYGTNKVRLFSFAEFDSIDGNDKYRLMNIKPGGANRDGCAVRFVAEKLYKRSEHEKLFIVVSDGQPYDGKYKGTAAELDLQAIRKEYTRKGITFLAAAIGNDKPAIKRCYGEDSFLDITDLNKFPLTIAKLIARQIV